MTDIKKNLVKRAGRHFGFFKRAGRHEKGAGRRALQKKPRQNTVRVSVLTFRRRLIWSVHNLLNQVTVILTKGPATCNDIVDDFVMMRALDAIFST